MLVVSLVEDLRAACAETNDSTLKIGFVPTMGALHRGHCHLIEVAKQAGCFVVVSIFVNPLQFNQQADLDCYPRTLEADLAMCRELGVDVVFTPQLSEMYPKGFDTHVDPGSLALNMEGSSRPGHFRGMATVVLKLFMMVSPDIAYFGKKDYQQLAIIRRMAIDFNLPIAITGVDTVRESDGLAMSSRNAQLTGPERVNAALFYEILQALEVDVRVATNNSDVESAVSRATNSLAAIPGYSFEYLVLCEASTLLPYSSLALTNEMNLVALGAIRSSSVRLIDNIEITRGGPS